MEKLNENILADPEYDGRDIALTHFSVKLLKEADVWGRIPNISKSPIKEARVLNGYSPYFLHFDHRKAGCDELGYLISNHLIRKAYYDEIKNFSNIELITDTTVTSINRNPEAATITLSNGKIIKTRLIIAADSRFSETRRSEGISARMLDFGQTCVVCRMQHEEPHFDIAYECFYYGRTLAVLPLTENQSSIVITAPSNQHNKILNIAENKFNKEVSVQFKFRLGNMKLISKRFAYPLIAVYANRFVSTRFALIGDAAVGMHPVTAHGFNLGLKGQNALAKEIKNALEKKIDIGCPSVLANYQSIHRRASYPLYLATNGIVCLYTNETSKARFLRKIILRFANNIWPVKRVILNKLTAIED